MILLESTPTERAAYLTYILVTGRTVTAQEAADLLAVSRRTAQRTLAVISRTVPIFREDETGEWRLVEGEYTPGHISPY